MTTVRNAASNFSNLASLTPEYLEFAYDAQGNTVQNALNNFLNDVSAANYTTVLTAFTAANTEFVTGKNATLRVLATTSDGTTFYDSSKITGNTNLNTYTNFLAKDINENHQGRPEILLALLSSSGIGLADRYSTSVSTTQKYQATRLGDSTNNNIGTFRLSLNDFITA